MQRLHRLGETLEFTRPDIGILELLLRYNTHSVFESMINYVFERPGPSTDALSIGGRALPMLLGLTPNEVQRRLKHDAPLVRSGLVTIDRDGDLEPISRLRRLVNEAGDGNIDVTRLLLDMASPD